MSTARLCKFQADFRDYLYRGRYEHNIAARLRSPGNKQARQRLDIYRNAYFIRLERALAHDFPVSERILGQNRFARLAGDYVLAHPSCSPSLRNLGHKFASWLRRQQTQIHGELATIEWAVMQVFDGPDVAPSDPDCLQSFSPADWPRFEITLLPTLTFLQLSSNADRVWLAKGENIELNTEPPRQLAIGRDERFRPVFTELDSDTFAVLTTLGNEPRLVIASEQLAETGNPASVPQRIAQSLHQALARGWVASIESTAI